MKFRPALGTIAGFACTLLLVGMASAQGGELVGAEWGVRGRRVDVTERVLSLSHDGVLQFEVSSYTLGVDPAPHRLKTLIVRVRQWDGNVQEFVYRQRNSVNLELDAPGQMERREQEERHEAHERREQNQVREESERREGEVREEHYQRHEGNLHILRAYYGADGQFANVTANLRSRIDDGRLYLRVDNRIMGVDPLPGGHKWLRILYSFNGERRNVVVPENADVQLP